ncbi:MAG: 16S rRNA (cytidine(1402)-2'-O)-methyltransferase [Cyclobacteriaceae bacterium]|nr:16S rRNA (cytidine(1402)-2'-O)-methyltransferase [Cyclobacteriaceae bacterium]
MKERFTSLYLVPTPIGNLKDITLRALEVLRNVQLILAEDTRTTGVLLKHYDIPTSQRSYHIHNEHKQVALLVERLKAGEQMALVTDAGTPGISDPGFLLARAVVEAGLEIECLPGATAFVPALVKSGLPSDRFVFEGFLPTKKGRQTKLMSIAEEQRTVVLYESPHRLKKALSQIVEFMGEERRISVSRELTKIFEETRTGPASEVRDYFESKEIKGEIVIVISGKC